MLYWIAKLLAVQMEVSRTALREAMKVLSAKELLESRTKIGTRVRDPGSNRGGRP